MSIVTSVLMARWLGPTDFGQMAFLLISFTSFKNLLDMASSFAFYTFISQRQRSLKFTGIYVLFLIFQFFCGMLLVLMLPNDFINLLWKSKDRLLILLGFLAAFFQGSAWNMVSQILESDRKTYRIQLWSTILVFINLGAISILWFSKFMGIHAVLASLALEYALASSWVFWDYVKNYKSEKSDETKESTKTILHNYVRFCRPFIPYTLIGFAYEFGDRWMLQHWGGSSQQAFFALASQFGAVPLLLTTSFLKIFWKEIAEAHFQGDAAQIENLYTHVLQKFFFTGCFFAGCLLPWSKEIVLWSVGPNYLAGASTFALMLLYPIHQSIGQVTGTMFYATSQTKTYTRLGNIFMIFSLIVAYALMAPRSSCLPGAGMGSEGLALKMVSLQAIQVNIMHWVLCKTFKWNFSIYNQLLSITTCLSIGFFARSTIELLFPFTEIKSFMSSCFLTAIFTCLAVYVYPKIICLENDKIKNLIFLLKQKIKLLL